MPLSDQELAEKVRAEFARPPAVSDRDADAYFATGRTRCDHDNTSDVLKWAFAGARVFAVLSFTASMILLATKQYGAGIGTLIAADALMLAVTIYTFLDRAVWRRR